MKKILLLGGSTQQVPPIEYAKSKGYYTILCDYLPDNPGQLYADKYYCVSTTDKAAILDVARSERIDGILAYASDPAAPTAAYVAEQLGLPTNPYKSVSVLADKEKFRTFLSENGFKTPRAEGFANFEEASKKWNFFHLPLLIKPVDSSGSKGIAVIYSLEELMAAIPTALRYSRSKRFLLEEYVEMQGYQIAGDGFSIDGKLVFRCFGNDHFDHSNLNPFVPVAASFPSILDNSLQSVIHAEIQRLLTLLNMRTGAYNFDIRLGSDNNVYLMEVGPRNGGCYIPQVINYATNVDMMKMSVDAAIDDLKLHDDTLKNSAINGYWSYYSIHSPKAGILKKISFSDNALQNNIIESHMNYARGDIVPSYTGSNGTIGFLIMKFTSMQEMLSMIEEPEQWLSLYVD